MQLGEILLQGFDGLLLVSRSLFQLVEVLLLADAGLWKYCTPSRTAANNGSSASGSSGK